MTYTKLLTILITLLTFSFIYSKFFDKPGVQSIKVQAATATNVINKELYTEFHYPIVNGEEVKNNPYVTLPFSKNQSYHISEGWIYSPAELKITGIDDVHGGVDYALPYGTPVLAPVDGYAISSYQSTSIIQEDGTERLYKNKPVHMGFGYFVRIYVPDTGRYVSMGHLSDVDKAIPFSPPEAVEDGWHATNTSILPEELATSEWVAKVKKGQVIGKVGYSGLTWGYEEYEEESERPVVIDPNKLKSWDEPHIHFEEHSLDEDYHAAYERDPYAIYNTFENYPSSDKQVPLGKDPLFLLNKDGQPKYADEP